MMKRLQIFACAVVMMAVPLGIAHAQDAAPAPAGAAVPSSVPEAPVTNVVNEAEYAGLVKLSYKMMTGFDFGRLRSLYSSFPIYAPHEMNATAVFEKFTERALAGDRAVANEATVFAKTHAALPEVHFLAAPLFRRMKMERTARYHEWMAGSLMGQMRKSGDGESIQTAYVPLTYTEEALLTRDSGKIIGRRKVEQDGLTYDAVMLEMDQSKRQVEIWFNTTLITQAEKR